MKGKQIGVRIDTELEESIERLKVRYRVEKTAQAVRMAVIEADRTNSDIESITKADLESLGETLSKGLEEIRWMITQLGK